MSGLRDTLAQYWLNIQGSLFPWLKEELGELTETQQQLISVLEMIRLEEFLHLRYGYPGRPPADRMAIARAFVAKQVYNMPTTRVLLERLRTDQQVRRICGWEHLHEVPKEWTFSRAFAEFSADGLPERVHAALIRKNYEGEIVGHISRDSTEIDAREKPLKKPVAVAEETPAEKLEQGNTGEPKGKELTRLERQVAGMSLSEMLADLPKACDVGTKKNSKGYKITWIGYKRHPSVAFSACPICPTMCGAPPSRRLGVGIALCLGRIHRWWRHGSPSAWRPARHRRKGPGRPTGVRRRFRPAWYTGGGGCRPERGGRGRWRDSSTRGTPPGLVSYRPRTGLISI